jgi:kynurenine formamidase
VCGPTAVTAEDKERIAAFRATARTVTSSPFGPDDQIGMLNLVDAASAATVLAEADPWKVFDLSVDYFVGMPSFTAMGATSYQMWMSQTPRGTVNDDSTGKGREQNELVAYSGECISMYTHCGTHVDTLSHFGYHGRIFNGFTEHEHLGGRGWLVAGADKHPPVIARGVVLDVAGAHGVDCLPDSYGIGEADLADACKRQGSSIRVGDMVFVRTGRMTRWPDSAAYIPNEPGLTLEGARFLAEHGAITVGVDNIGVEQQPTGDPDNWQVVHCYLLAEAGVPMMEIVNLEELVGEGIYEFAYLGACLRLRGATGSPVRPFALPLRKG